jgi:hypothetical protein
MTLQADFDLPAICELAQRPQWVRWKREWRDNQPTKPPLRLDGKGHASSTNPATWSTFDACATFAQSAGIDRGVGFVFTADDGYLGVDLDGARDPSTGELSPWATDLIVALDSYTEVSPSLTGVKVFVKAAWPDKGRKVALTDAEQICWRPPALEVYDRERYFTVTGMHVAGTPATIEARQDAIDDLYATFFADTRTLETESATADVQEQISPGLSDEQVLELAFGAINGERIRALYEDGDISSYDDDDSRADLALVSFLGFYTGSDAAGLEQLDRLFRASKLYRSKWERSDYRTRTFRKAFANLMSVYHSERVSANSANSPGPSDLPDSPAWRQSLARAQSSVPSQSPLVGTELLDRNTPLVPSSNGSKIGLDPNRLRGIDAAELRAQDAPDEVASLPLLGQGGYIILGWSNLLAAYPRTGKTELLAACIPDWLNAGHRVLCFTEEPLALWRLRLRRREAWPTGCRLVFGLGIDPGLLLAEMHASNEDIVIVDAIRNLLAFIDENDNSEVARKINPWVVSAREGDKTLELVHHLRKGAGDHGEGIAGGHALLGAVDIALELLRDQHGVPNRRRIRAWARLIQPSELLYEQDAQQRLVALGDPASLDQNALEERVMDQLTDEWSTTQEVHAALGDPKPSQEGVRTALTALAERSRVERDPPIELGRVRGKAHRWRLPSTSSVPTKGLSLGTELSDTAMARAAGPAARSEEEQEE